VADYLDATSLTSQATRYLAAIDCLRSLGLEVKWRSEADERGTPSFLAELPPSECEHCAGPLVRINGQHICLRA
jgi:hypothetical protein